MPRFLLWMLIALVGCARSGAQPTTAGDTEESATPEEAVEPPQLGEPSAATIGTWTTQAVGRGGVQGLFVVDGSLRILLGQVGGTLRLGRTAQPDSRWTFEPIEDDGPVIFSAMASEGETQMVSIARCDEMATHCELAVGNLGEHFEIAVADCQMASLRHALVVTAGEPAIVHSCGDDFRITVRQGSEWHDRVIDSRPAWVVGAAVDAAGTAYVQGPHSTWIVEPDRIVGGAMPESSNSQAIAACRGRVWAAFEVDTSTEGAIIQAGLWDGTTWALERIPSTVLGVTTIGFDEECRPFVAVANEVFARGVDEWRGGALPSPGIVKGLIAFDGTLYAGLDDGGNTSIAMAPISTE